MDTPESNPQRPSEQNGHSAREKPARLSATLLGAGIAVVQSFVSVIYCTCGAGAVALDKEGVRLALPITAFGIVIGGIAGYIAAPPNWAGWHTLRFATIIFGSVLVASFASFVGLMLFEVVADALWGNPS
jgi:hypothetical protein